MDMTDFPNEFPFQSSLLARDHKLFLELSTEEANEWIPLVFERVRPHMPLINALIVDDVDNDPTPVNLSVVLMIARQPVREVAAEMAASLLTPDRQKMLIPLLGVYCDELLAQGRGLDATFVQQGLIDMQRGQQPGQNPLLVEVCLASIHHQVMLINGGPHAPLLSH
jgi:hypothetical protein